MPGWQAGQARRVCRFVEDAAQSLLRGQLKWTCRGVDNFRKIRKREDPRRRAVMGVLKKRTHRGERTEASGKDR
jgi:hypothetical protein